jgi:hypothetical protein
LKFNQFAESFNRFTLIKGSGAKVGDYANILDNLNKKKSIFLTPLN